MPEVSIVVEGHTDVAFIVHLNPLLSLPEGVSLAAENAKGRSNLQPAAKALLIAGATDLIIAEDIDERDATRVIESHTHSISSFLGSPAVDAGNGRFRIGDVTLDVIPMGVIGNSGMDALGISSHSMEDYLIKLLLDDPSLRIALPRFDQLLGDLLTVIRGDPHRIAFDSSKELFQLAKPLIKHGFSPNPPKDTDGRREGSGRGWVRELQGRWPGVLG